MSRGRGGAYHHVFAMGEQSGRHTTLACALDQLIEPTDQALERVARGRDMAGTIDYHGAIGGNDGNFAQIDAAQNVVGRPLQPSNILKPGPFAERTARKSNGSAANAVGIGADPSDHGGTRSIDRAPVGTPSHRSDHRGKYQGDCRQDKC